ncbi:hypothetical protein Lser_V15G27847 [Lactuca serriola]
MEKVDEDANLEFKWLIKKGRGGKNKEVQFYGSFIYDGVEYVLYDCVYMYKEGLREPYIGKLTKIWENADKSKKVKVHWFFRPEEISKWLGDTRTLENEILFASGEGVGLTNISPLEAIAGKCNVVCVSKDSRNPQPSDEELKAADFIFYRTFDVESCTILDNMDEEKIGGIEIKHIFNRREDESISTLPETTTTSTDKKEENHNTITLTTSSEPNQLLLTKTLPNTNNLKDDDAQDKNIPILAAETTSVALLEKTNPKIDEKADKDAMEANKRKKSSTTGSDKLHEQPSKKMKLDDKNPPKEKQVEVVEVDRDSVGLKDVMPSKKSKVDNNVRTGGKNSDIGKTDTSVVKTDKDNLKSSKEKDETKVSKVSKERKKTPMESDKLDDRPLKKMKSKLVANEKQKQVEVEGEKIEKLTDLPSKKSKVEDKSAPNEKQKHVDVVGEKIEKLTDLPSKKSKDEVKSPRNEKPKQVEVEGEKIEKLTDLPSKKSKVEDKSAPNEKQKQVEVEGEKIEKLKSKVEDKSAPNEKQKHVDVVGEKIEKLTDLPSKKSKVEDKSAPNEKQKQVEVEGEKIEKLKSKVEDKSAPNEKQKHVDVVGEKIEKLTDLPSKKSKVEDKSAPNEKQKQVEVEGEKIEKLKSKVEDKSAPNEKRKHVDVVGEKIEKLTDLPSKKSKDEVKSPRNEKQKQVEVVGEKIEKSTGLPSKKSKDEVKSARNVNNLGTSGTQEEKANGNNNNNNKGKISDELEGRRLKKTKAEGSFKIPDNKKNSSIINSNGSNGKNLLVASEGKSKSIVVGTNNNINKENQSESNESKKKLSMSQSPKDMYKEFVVGPKPNADESGWFERLPWEQSLKSAYDQGSAILLHNVDPDYTSGEVEDLVWHAFTENCEAKILPHSVISSPHCYQALVLLKTKEAAHRVLAKLDEDCLMLSNGRPLVGTPCPPIIPRKTCKFFGHLSIDRIKINQREMEEAVSTSHFSQPNTIEYDMAMEWFLMQSKSKKWWEMIYKLQGNEVSEVEEKLVKK